MMNRRQLMGAGIGAGAAALTVNMGQAQTRFRDLPEAASTDSPYTQVPPRPTTGLEYNPVVTLNGWSLPYRMNGNVKEFHLVAEPVERVMADGMIARLWGNNGQSTGPHLHLTVWERGYGGRRIDPEVWLKDAPHPGETPKEEPKMILGIDISEHQDGLPLRCCEQTHN